jgi:hypothetical protein
MPATAAATRTTQQQRPVEQEGDQQSQPPFIVWVGMAAEAASAFETSSYSPRQGMRLVTCIQSMSHAVRVCKLCSRFFSVRQLHTLM